MHEKKHDMSLALNLGGGLGGLSPMGLCGMYIVQKILLSPITKFTTV